MFKSNRIKRQTIIVKREQQSNNDNNNEEQDIVDINELNNDNEEQVEEDCDEEECDDEEDDDNDNDNEDNDENIITDCNQSSNSESNELQTQQSIHSTMATITMNTPFMSTNDLQQQCQQTQQSFHSLKTETNSSQTGSQHVTYRVVSVGHSNEEQQQTTQLMTTGHTLVATHGPQTIITPFGGTTTPTGVGGADGGVGGPFYVMMTTPTQEIIQTTNIGHTRRSNKTTHESSHSSGYGRQARDEKRRATHNEVERRRRDKINNWIMKLSKVVPDCQQDHTKQGQSKGGILAKATEYIQELCHENQRLNEFVKENEILSNELETMRQQIVETKNENRKLKLLLQKNGINCNENEN